ncbi:MAG TPA: DUF2292 domain-containing protein [Elusimicrobia bacterium]|jgi:hypothetical protein|nr:DUF2292 domain-containing protein [Elusimicrobiota bacterium]
MEIKQDKTNFTKIDEQMVAKIVQAIQSVRYGCIQIVIHNSEIVQIEKTEKMRFEKNCMKCK